MTISDNTMTPSISRYHHNNSSNSRNTFALQFRHPFSFPFPIPVPLLLLLLLLCHVTDLCSGTWTHFDLVRPRGGWGSDGHTPFAKFNSSSFPELSASDFFGFSVANIGDLDHDGVDDIAVGAPGEDVTYADSGLQVQAGGMYILFMHASGLSFKSYVHLNGLSSNFPRSYESDEFGYAVSGIGDLDADGTNDIAIGAPGFAVSSVYVLFMHANGTVRDFRLIRGKVSSTAISRDDDSVNSTTTDDTDSSPNATTIFTNITVPTFLFNGPPLTFGSRFGSAITNWGDFNGDGVTDMAVSAITTLGSGVVYFLFLTRNATVLSWTKVNDDGLNGGPTIREGFTNFAAFGSSLLAMSDIDSDGVNDFAIGASEYTETSSTNVRAGAVFVCFMKPDATMKNCTRISEMSGANSRPHQWILPSVPQDKCGSSLTSLGDINQDDKEQRSERPADNLEVKVPARPSIEDLVTGCPQTAVGTLTGHLLFLFLKLDGSINGYTALPSPTTDLGRGKHDVGLSLMPLDQLGRSLATWMDADNNFLKELIVGAPGDDSGGKPEAGAVYVFFPRRRRHHYRPFDWLTFWLIITIPSFCFVASCVGSTTGFFYYFRRKPDAVELIILENLKPGLIEIGKPPPIKVFERKDNLVYADYYME